ncbi:uncharacterized protein LOC135927257 [Gordionus sp. m RMFG-2023]|uniref:uncharacterized protein LOC135927257 n=1 Tax=Gordionus sp. m RMFG-2023 TaxID=3053472 RepID=UPI0031FCDF77
MDILNPENMPEEIKAIFILPDPDPDRNFVDNTSYRLREHLSDSDLSTNKNSKTWALSESKYLYGRESVERGKGITQNSKSMQVSQNSIDGSYDIVTKTKTSGYHSDSFTYLPPPPPPSIPILPPSLPPTSPLTLKPSKNSFEIGTKKYHEDGYELIITNADLEGYITNSIAPNKTSAHSLPKSSAITASQCLADFSASQKAAFIDRKLSPLYQPMEDHYFDSDKTPDGYYSIDIKKSAVKFFSPVTMFSPPNSPVKQGSKPTGVLLSLYDHTEKHGCDCCLKYPEIRKILNLSYFEQPSDTECMNRMILDQKKEKKENETSRLNATLNDTKRGSKIRRYSDIVEDILARHIKNRHKSG